MKKYLMFLLYCTGLVLGTVILNTQFNITALPYCSNLDWNFVNYIQLLVKRVLELILIFIFLRILPVHIRTAAMFLISGCILGGLGFNQSLFRLYVESAFLWNICVWTCMRLYGSIKNYACRQ